MNRIRGRGFFFVAGVAWLAMVTLLPSMQPAGRLLSASADNRTGSGDVAAAAAVASQTAAAAAAAPTGGVAATSGPARGGLVAGAVGKTRGGIECKPGVPQIPDSPYAPPCRPKFTGDNGGATWNGVTATTIKISDRELPATIATSGGPLPPEALEIINTMVKYFNDNFELYGRRVIVDPFLSPHGDSLAEAAGKGRDAACADAITLTQEHHSFAVIQSSSQVFEDCAAQHQLVVTESEGRPTEPFLAARDPYLWTTEQECFRVAYQGAEYLGKRLNGRPARYAGQADYRERTRKFGILVPDSEATKPCLDIVKRVAADRYGIRDFSQFDYVIDFSSLAEQTARAAIKFKAEGVTTIILGSDPITFQFMTQAARNQDWHPEWINVGIAGTDADSNGQSYDQSEVAGHMLGRSEYPDDATLFGPGNEGARLYKKITGKVLPEDFGTGGFYQLIQLFTLLQEAGPNLTPFTLGQGARALPMRVGPIGAFSYQFNSDGTRGFSHGATLDSNELYWDADKIGSNGKRGGFVVSRTRYFPGQWPTTPPDVYPGL